MLEWSRADLAKHSGVGFSSMMRIESAIGVPGAHAKTFEAIEKAFEQAGIEFIGSPDDRPGVRLRNK